MDIKRVAFETRPVASKPSGCSPTGAVMPRLLLSASPATGKTATPKVSREEIAAIVDRFLANRPTDSAPLPPPAPVRAEAPPPPQGPTGNGGTLRTAASSNASSNASRAADFVSEDDVKARDSKGEKIYIGPKTIITRRPGISAIRRKCSRRPDSFELRVSGFRVFGI